MPKRKRDEEDEGINKIPDRAVRIKASRLKVLVDRGCSQLTAQLRLARGFDRQKMTRRIKDAGGDPTKLARLNAELEVLKTMEPSRTASEYLVKQMGKMKRVREDEAFRALYGEETATAEQKKAATPKSVEEGNVLGRLFKAKAVASVMPDILRGIRDLLGVDKPSTTAEGVSNGQNRNGADAGAGAATTTNLSETGPDEEFDGFSEPASEELADYNDRIAASSDAQSEDDIAAQNDDRGDSMSITTDEDAEHDYTSHTEDDDEISLASSSTSTSTSNDLPKHKPYNPTISRSQPSTATTTTTTTTRTKANSSFLPTLMMTGYFSGSSDNEDAAPTYNPDADLQTAQTARKNRRGQRARQKIAEQKFGARAKHLARQERKGTTSASTSTSAGAGGAAKWDPRRGAVDGSRGGGGKTNTRVQKYLHDRRAGATRSAATGGNEIPVSLASRRKAGDINGSGKKEGEKAVHPSWEAARKRKLEMKTRISIGGVGGGAGVGRKITFD